jgi:hypothetical protein
MSLGLGPVWHLGYLPDDYDAVLASARNAGWGVYHVGLAARTRFAYLDGRSHLGAVAEIVDLSEDSRSFFDHMKHEAATWDGETRPVRRLGPGR